MKITFDANFDGLASIFEDYEYAKERMLKTRRKLGYRKDQEVRMETAPSDFQYAVHFLDAKTEGTNTLWLTSRKLYKAVAMARRIDKRFMVMHNWMRCLPDWQMERLMDYYMREDD